MANIRLFKGWRPLPEKVARVASRPYDVLNSAEARLEAADNPDSFLHVVKPEIDLPEDINQYDPKVYQTGRDNFHQLIAAGTFVQDPEETLYVYRQIMDGHSQLGFFVCVAVEDYVNNLVKKHELTRPDKEEDRKTHVRVSGIHAEPVFFAYRSQTDLDAILAKIEAEESPVNDFITEDGVQHTLWAITDEALCAAVPQLFAEKVPAVYVADGHHRTAAAALVGKEVGDANPHHTGEESYNYFMAVIFPDDQLKIIDYNRVVKDLNGLSSAELLDKLRASFSVEKKGSLYKPAQLHEFSMYLDGDWYALHAKPDTYNDDDPIGVLDVTILSEQVLEPLLGIKDLRRDKRIEFVGGIRGLEELARRVDNGEMKVAFALYPVSMQQLMDIADNDMIMPPKVTWFEPKLRSGLVVHKWD
ncbi:MAG: DUF1015 family protein [Bacteroidota bacterium]